MSIMLDMTNEEQLLHLALWVSTSIADEKDFTRCISDELIISYIMDEYERKGKTDFNEQDIIKRYSELAIDFVLTQAVKEGKVEVDMSGEETLYSLTRNSKLEP